MRRFLFIASLALLTLPSVGCCYRSAACDPCTGLAYGGGWEPSPLLNCSLGGPGGLFDSCCTGGFTNACCAPVVGMAPSASCCETAGPVYHSTPAYAPSSVPSPTPTPQLSVPRPMGVPANPEPVSYYSPQVESGLKVTSHPETTAPVHQQAQNPKWIKAGY